MPDLTRIRGLVRCLGGVTHDAREGDAEGDTGFVASQQLRRCCHPVTRISVSQPKADFEGKQRENGSNVNEPGSTDEAKNAHFQKCEDWKIRYLERAAVREFDGNLTRDYAERAAWQEIVAEWAELHGADRHEAEAALIVLGLTRPPA